MFRDVDIWFSRCGSEMGTGRLSEDCNMIRLLWTRIRPGDASDSWNIVQSCVDPNESRGKTSSFFGILACGPVGVDQNDSGGTFRI